MGDGVRLVWLRSEVTRLGAVIDAPPDLLVSFDPSVDSGHPYIWVEPGGPYGWIVRERGQTLEDRSTSNVDDVLFWSFRYTTSSIASRWAARHGEAHEDFRVAHWAEQQELLMRLNAVWAARWRQELIASVPDAASLLPSL